jgi:hypothetical protein
VFFVAFIQDIGTHRYQMAVSFEPAGGRYLRAFYILFRVVETILMNVEN